MSDLGQVWLVWREARPEDFGILVGVYSSSEAAAKALEIIRSVSGKARYQVSTERVLGQLP